MDSERNVTADGIRDFFGIVDEGNIVSDDDLEEVEVIEWPVPMNE